MWQVLADIRPTLCAENRRGVARANREWQRTIVAIDVGSIEVRVKAGSVHFLRILGRGARDVYDQFAYFMLLSIAWVLAAAPAFVGYTLLALSPLLIPVAIFTAFLVPPATVTLFALTDPRRVIDRPDLREVMGIFGDSVKRSWQIALVTIPVLIVLIWNTMFFSGTESYMAAFVPLWLIMLVFLFILTLYMFALAGLMESGVRNAFRGGMFVLVSRPFVSLFISLFIIIVGVLFTVSVLPMLTIGAPLFAAIVNRMVLTELKVPVIDPNQPTSEREWEKERGLNTEPTIWDRLKRGGRARQEG